MILVVKHRESPMGRAQATPGGPFDEYTFISFVKEHNDAQHFDDPPYLGFNSAWKENEETGLWELVGFHERHTIDVERIPNIVTVKEHGE